MRSFTIHILTRDNTPVVDFSRGYACGYACVPCLPQLMTARHPISGEIMGYVKQRFTLGVVEYEIQDEKEQVWAVIRGRCCKISCCNDVPFSVMAENEIDEIGVISKKWSGCAKEFFTVADNFEVEFPQSFPPNIKLLFIGASLLIDFMYFEYKPKN